MTVTITTDNHALNRALNRVVLEVGADLGPTVKRSARLATVELAFRTQPYGKSAQVQAKGKAAVERDIRRVYTNPGFAYRRIKEKHLAALFWAVLQAGDIREANAVLRRAGLPPLEAWDDGAAHQAARDRGRVPDRTTPIALTPAANKRLAAYIKKQQKNVGFAKGGFAACARLLGGTRGIPGWVSRQKSPGRVVDATNRRIDPYVLFENLVTYLPDQLPEGHYHAAMATVARNLLISVDAIVRNRLRRHGMAA